MLSLRHDWSCSLFMSPEPVCPRFNSTRRSLKTWWALLIGLSWTWLQPACPVKLNYCSISCGPSLISRSERLVLIVEELGHMDSGLFLIGGASASRNFHLASLAELPLGWAQQGLVLVAGGARAGVAGAGGHERGAVRGLQPRPPSYLNWVTHNTGRPASGVACRILAPGSRCLPGHSSALRRMIMTDSVMSGCRMPAAPHTGAHEGTRGHTGPGGAHI